ncbi:MAG TPA: efflux RND transporter periplasmic adaptor subunit [Gemmataceae bacterium]|jgi:multidrug efflux pump subunit AcrA (membrane-fusion protein)|nr:efflux RND transporter periplasmic adaptor subunit [Gemmataceae bacterium]
MCGFLCRRWVWLALVLVVAAAAVAAMLLHARYALRISDPEQARAYGQPIPVRTVFVQESQVDEIVGATGLTNPSDAATIMVGPSSQFSSVSPVSAIVIKEVLAYEGDYVRKGQVLFRLNSDAIAEVVNQRVIAVRAAEAALARVKEQVSYNQKLRELELTSAKAERKYRTDDLENRKKELDVIRKLYKEKGATFFDLVSATSTYLSAAFAQSETERHVERARDAIPVGLLKDKEDVLIGSNTLETARVDLNSAHRDLKRMDIVSPIDGVVTVHTLVPGETVGVNQTLTNVLKIDPIFVRVDYPQERIDEVAVGRKVDVVLDSHPKETFHGTVIRVAGQVNPQLRVLPVVVLLSNPSHRIKASVSGFVRIHVTKKVVTVPTAAVLQGGDKATVFRVESGRARVREIRTGGVVGDGEQEVLGGLSVGDEVVLFHNFYPHAGSLVQGLGYLQDNDPVDANWRRWARRE